MSQYNEFEIAEDLSNVQEFAGDGGGAPALPPGEYVFDVVHLEQGTSKSSSQPKIEVTFEVVEGDYAGTRVTNNYSLQPQAIGRLKKLMMAVGARLDKIRSAEILGGRCRAAIVHNEGQQQMNADGTPKLGADGQPLRPRVFANVVNERPMEEVKQEAAPPPPVARGNRAAGTNASRRA